MTWINMIMWSLIYSQIILECEVNCALGNISKNKDSGGDGISFQLLTIRRDNGVKVLH